MSKKILADPRISRRQFGKSMVKSTGILGSVGMALPFFSCIEKKEKLLKEDQKFVVDTHIFSVFCSRTTMSCQNFFG